MEPGNVILELSDILTVVESVLLCLCPNDNDCDKKIKLKQNISVKDCLLMLQSDNLPNDGRFLTFCIFNFFGGKKPLITSFYVLRNTGVSGCAEIVIVE